MRLYDVTPGGLFTDSSLLGTTPATAPPASASLPRKRGVPADWVLFHLEDGDELGSQPGHIVESRHNLAELAGLNGAPGGDGWRRIVEGNGEKARDTNAWVVRPLSEGGAGGARNSLGTPVFTSKSAAYLPPHTPRAPVVDPSLVPSKGSRGPSVLQVVAGFLGAVVVAGVIAAATSKPKRKESAA